MSTRHVRVGEVLAGRYRIDRELGAGAMGVVYAAWHLELDQPVALKLVTAPINDLAAATTRFRREVRAAAKIRSEHVARVLDVGALENGVPYMVLELLRGNDLECELARRGPVSVPEAVDIVLQIIEALAEAHAAGIVHRDLKPANLFLAERADKTTIIKVLDFGISKSILGDSNGGNPSLTQTGMMMGSPLYMSPEQMQSTRDTDARCDIWALGVVLYQMLTGTTPFRGDSILELCAVVFRDAPAPVAKYRADIPAGLERIILKCLQRDRELRYQNVGELSLALLEFAPPQARVHSERANRVLFPETYVSAVYDAPGVSRGAVEGAVGQMGSLNTTSKDGSVAPTQEAWNSGEKSRTTRVRRRVIGTGLVVGTLGFFGALYTVLERPSIIGTKSLAGSFLPNPSRGMSSGLSVNPVASPPESAPPAVASQRGEPVTVRAVVTQATVTVTPATTVAPTNVAKAKVTKRARETVKVPSKVSGNTLDAAKATELPDYGGRR